MHFTSTCATKPCALWFLLFKHNILWRF
jgi:hypothetical protein